MTRLKSVMKAHKKIIYTFPRLCAVVVALLDHAHYVGQEFDAAVRSSATFSSQERASELVVESVERETRFDLRSGGIQA